MSKLHTILRVAVFMCCVLVFLPTSAQQKEDPGKAYISLRYYNINNNIQYLLLTSQLRKNNQVRPQPGKSYEIYMETADPAHLLGKVVTDRDGNANAVIPPALKPVWDSAAQHVFIVKQGEEEIISDFTITKSKIEMDTTSVDSVKTITVKVSKWDNGNWSAASGVEMKVGVKRLGGIISLGDEETYTTDSLGSISFDVSKKGFPGDLKGDFILTAKVEDNDSYGNLIVEKIVPWGTVLKPDNSFFETRALWSTRTRAPFWLLFMAYGIVISVWATLIYLVILLIRIKKLGTQS